MQRDKQITRRSPLPPSSQKGGIPMGIKSPDTTDAEGEATFNFQVQQNYEGDSS